jgi:predicted Rossmann fold nucleotide-binding protein DprA/Smf involved in DNA uptake
LIHSASRGLNGHPDTHHDASHQRPAHRLAAADPFRPRRAAALERLPDLARRGGADRPGRIYSAEDARAELAASRQFGVSLLAPGEAGYPPRLAMLEDAPPLLGVRSAPDVLMRPMIAMDVEPEASDRARITSLLGPTPLLLDDLIRMAGTSPAIVRTVLLELELAGRLERHGGGLVSLI